MDAIRGPVYRIRLRELRDLIKPISSFNRPSTFGEATARMKHNLSYFSFTYAMVVLLIIFLSFFLHPEVAAMFFINYPIWILFYFFYDVAPVVVFNYCTVDDQLFLGVVAVPTVLLYLFTYDWLYVSASILIGFAIVVIHATFRSTEDLPFELHGVDAYEELPEM